MTADTVVADEVVMDLEEVMVVGQVVSVAEVDMLVEVICCAFLCIGCTQLMCQSNS